MQPITTGWPAGGAHAPPCLQHTAGSLLGVTVATRTPYEPV